MHRIDTEGTVVAAPATAAVGSTVGYFYDGDPESGQPATVVDDDWLNSVQEELVSILTAAGITPDKTVRTQVRDAINQLSGKGVTVAKVFADSPITATRAQKQQKISTAGGNVLVNLPAAATCDGEHWTFIKTTGDANTVTLDANGGELINDALTQVLDQQWASLEIMSIGTGWVIV